MKKLPVCKACISGALCFACQEKFDKGYITQFDIDLATDLLELERGEKFPQLKTASFYNAVDVGEIVFLVIGKGNRVLYTEDLLSYIKELYEINEIILIEKGSAKEMLEQIIAPAKMLGINKIYIPTGDTEYRVVISAEDKEKVRIPIELLEDAASIMIRGIAKLRFS
ncbi:MAG: hypothetical protein GF364_18610 [Candidatus Lokiarchaeota archaeon]|nr:hypothetical protein [Candidatus Lokiarchaeota archaeon]